MSGRTGFTLLELLVAIVLAGVVALLVYGTADAGRETQARLLARRHTLQTARAFRATLADALRNARPARTRGDTAFWIEGRRDTRSRPVDRLRFVTAGGLPPLTADADWAVELAPTPEGLLLTATPIGLAVPPRVVVVYPGVTGLRVRVLNFATPPDWTDRWVFPALVPRGVELSVWTEAGPVGAPLRLALPLGGVQ